MKVAATRLGLLRSLFLEAAHPHAEAPGTRRMPLRAPAYLGWHNSSDATCLIRPPVFSTALLV